MQDHAIRLNCGVLIIHKPDSPIYYCKGRGCKEGREGGAGAGANLSKMSKNVLTFLASKGNNFLLNKGLSVQKIKQLQALFSNNKFGRCFSFPNLIENLLLRDMSEEIVNDRLPPRSLVTFRQRIGGAKNLILIPFMTSDEKLFADKGAPAIKNKKIRNLCLEHV